MIKPVQSPDAVLETRLWANHGVRVYANRRLSLGEEGKVYGAKAKTSTGPEKSRRPASWGTSENVALVEMCSHLATERAGMEKLHLTVGASELYPNPRGNGEQRIG